ncbi:MAG TPA: hypothetical protein VFE59_16970 [Trebonia sp.]|nr:hypothetical protein [Trebonia sp.]
MWLAVLLIVVVLVGAAAALTALLARHGFEWSAKFSEIASFALAVLVVLLPAAGRLAVWPPAPRIRAELISSDVSDLAAALRAQGRTEAPLPGVSVYDRLPMQVRWESVGAGAGNQSTGTFREVVGYFRGLPEQRLVVLGGAGAGKSVLATELARNLLARRGSEDPVPVIFSMVGWDPEHTTLFDWMSGQLARVVPDLGQKVSDGHQVVTRAQVLVDRLKVLPILDGLDEVGSEALPAATLAVNRYGWAQPLIVTCRDEAYLEAIRQEPGTAIAQAAVIELVPLTVNDVDTYVGPDRDGRWAAVRDRLADEPDGPLARALRNPLMLWLAWEVYRSGQRDPAELADRYRFGRQQAIERRLLSGFLPAVYPAEREYLILRQWRFQPTARRARRWLGFLASDHALRAKGPGPGRDPSRSRGSGEQQRDDVETLDKSVAWWYFTAAAGGVRFLGVAIRALVLWIVLWHQITTIFSYAGNWRNGAYAGHLPFQRLFLDGPLGRYVWPTARQAIDFAPASTRGAAFTTLNRGLGDVVVIPSHHLFLFAVAAIVLMIGYVGAAEPIRPRGLRASARLPVGLVTGVAMNVLVLAVVALIAASYWGQSSLISDFFTMRRTWLALLVLALGATVYGLPRLLVAEIDIIGATTPPQSLREDRLAAVISTVSRRVLLAVTLALFCGSEIATTYAVFAVVSTLIRLTLGGLHGFASSSYADACFWLAITGKLPWRPMRFLTDAGRRGVFVEIGAVFMFRHIRVQLALEDWYRANRASRGDPGSWLQRQLRNAIQSIIPPLSELDRLQTRANSYRKLAQQNQAEFGPHMLLALEEQAQMLATLQRQDEEIAIRSEITATARELAASGQMPLLTVATTLERLAHCLAKAGLTYEASGVMTEAAHIYRQAPADERRQFEHRLANWIDLFPYDIGTRTSSHDLDVSADEMADVYRDLVLTEADTTSAAHADSLIRMAGLFRHQRRPADAAKALKGAAQIYRELTKAHSAVPEPAGAGKLLSLAGPLRQAGLNNHAIAVLTTAARAYRMLAESEPDQAGAYRASLASSLVLLADLLGRLHQPSELGVIRQAVDVYGAVADDTIPEARLTCPPLADLRRLAIRLWKLGQTGEAVTAAQTARRLADLDAADQDATRTKADLLPQEVSAKIRRLTRQARRHPEQLTLSADGRLVQSPAAELDTMAFQLLAAKRTAESRMASQAAVYAGEAAVMRYRQWATDMPDRFLPYLADSLSELAGCLRRAGSRETEAAAAAAEASDIRRRLSQQASDRGERPPS